MSLTAEQNDLLTRVEGEAPMGRYLRETAWIPAVISSALIAGDAPYPVRLLGEDYVAFRADDGRVGFFVEYCPHRGASLLLARNEDNALRCIFHGWKFRVDGKTVEAPTQPHDQEAFCSKAPLEHFPTHEAAGVVWVYLGEGEPPPLPGFPFMTLSGENVAPAHSILNFNWLQALEGLVDSAHVSVLHQDWLSNIAANPKLANAKHDAAPVYEFDETPGGFRYAAVRQLPTGDRYIRITEFVAPWYSFTPGDQGSCFICIPVDDYTTAFWGIRHDARAPIMASPWKPPEGADPMNWPPALPGGKAQRWGQDRAAMKDGAFSGFGQHFFHEDVSVAASQGRIARRNKEFLNSGDLGVVRLRSLLMRAVRDFAAGRPQEKAAGPDIRITAGHGTLPVSADWRTSELA